MTRVLQKTVSEQELFETQRLDSVAAAMFDLSRSRVQVLIAEGALTVNGKKCDKKLILTGGEELCLVLPEEKELSASPQELPLQIVYEDEHLLVVDKPRGMVVHPAPGNPDGTLVNALMFHCRGRLSSINGVIRPGIVHRIDKDTSGLLIVAKTDEAHKGLAKQIEEHSFIRRYEAVVFGRLKQSTGTVDAPVGRHHTDRKKMAVTDRNSKKAVTHWRVIAETQRVTHLELTLETGRTHQIRVHMAHIGHPVIGDPVYGTEKTGFGLNGQCLFAKYIKFCHPITGREMEFCAELPEYFLEILKKTGLSDRKRHEDYGEENHS